MLGYVILLSRQLNTVMMLIFPNWYTDVSQFLSKSYQVFIDINKLIIKFICKGVGIRVAEMNVCCIYVNGLILLF